MIICNNNFLGIKGKYVLKDFGTVCTAEGKVETVEECKYLAKYAESIHPKINNKGNEETNVQTNEKGNLPSSNIQIEKKNVETEAKKKIEG